MKGFRCSGHLPRPKAREANLLFCNHLSDLKAPLDTTKTISDPTNVPAALRHPSAFLPITMSLLALSLVLFHLLMYGTAREPDEGTAAHLWQLLMGLQVPIIAFFAIRWLPVSPRSAIAVLGLQLVAGIAAAAPVFYFHL